MSHVHVRMKDTGEIRHLPDYVAEHLVSRNKAVIAKTEATPVTDADSELVDFVISRGYAKDAAEQIVSEHRDAVRADFEAEKAGVDIDADDQVETAMESPAANQATETAVTPAQKPPARRPSRRRQ